MYYVQRIALLVLGIMLLSVSNSFAQLPAPQQFFTPSATLSQTAFFNGNELYREKIITARVSVINFNCQPSLSACSLNGTNFTKSGTDWDGTGSTDCGPPGLTINYSATAGVTPTSGNSLNNALFTVGTHTITWTATDACGTTATCSSTVTITAIPAVTIS